MHFPQYVSVQNSWPLFFFIFPLFFFCNQISMHLTTIGAAESHNPPATPHFFPLIFRSLGMIGKLKQLLPYPDLMGVPQASRLQWRHGQTLNFSSLWTLVICCQRAGVHLCVCTAFKFFKNCICWINPIKGICVCLWITAWKLTGFCSTWHLIHYRLDFSNRERPICPETQKWSEKSLSFGFTPKGLICNYRTVRGRPPLTSVSKSVMIGVRTTGLFEAIKW